MPDSTISNLTAQTTLHDADLGVGVDTTDTTQSANGTTKKWTWTTIKAFLKTYFDTLYFALANLDTDGTLAANSDTKIPSQKAVKTYADAITTAQNLKNSGWISVSDAWTYASATTITVPTGAASLYKKGDKIRLTQTTVKYFYVIGVADTVLTVTGGSDYAVANAAISAISVSHIMNPVGFPDYFNAPNANFDSAYIWTAAHGTAATSTFRFKIIENKCFCFFVMGSDIVKNGAGNIFSMTRPAYLPALVYGTVGVGNCGQINLPMSILDKGSGDNWNFLPSSIANATAMASGQGEFTYEF